MPNQAVVLAKRPEGVPEADMFQIRPRDMPAEPTDGKILVKLTNISVDPYMRSVVTEKGSPYLGSWDLESVPRGFCTGRVIASASPEYAVGDEVAGQFSWELYQVVEPAPTFFKIDTSATKASVFVGALGMPGLTAYFALNDVGRPKEGETIYVSGAAGAVGSVVCQLAKAYGLRVIGSASSQDKLDWLTSVGVDHVFNYKTTSVAEGIAAGAPDGIDLYFDNVGGESLSAALDALKPKGRVVCCGAISQYNNSKPEDAHGITNMFQVIVKQLRIEGFMAGPYFGRFAEFTKAVAGLIGEGKLQVRETTVEGMEKVGEAFRGLFTGANTGKMVVAVPDE